MNREAMTETIIFARDLTRIYPLGANEVVGLNHVDLMVPAGEFVVLKGASGSGKSTIANVLMVKLLEMGGRPVTLLGKGLNRFQFVHAEDVAAACLLARRPV